jgi:excinuclease ABC subunit C
VLPEAPADRALLEKAFPGLAIVVPKGGERRRMLGIAGENARAALLRRGEEEARDEAALEALRRLCDLAQTPETIDGFDVSTTQGVHVVASRVRFRNGRADKSGYRRFKIRGVEGQDDFASMKEAVARSLKRGVADGELPDLVVIDGGRAQLAVALEAAQEAGAFDVAMIGLAKARAERAEPGVPGGRVRRSAREERIFVPGAVDAIPLGRHDATRHLLERIRDEAHRFAITYHRKERGKIRSQLDAIPGVGPAKRKALLKRFGSVAGVKQASIEELLAIPGISADLAERIREELARS